MNSTCTGTNQREFDAVTKILQSYATHAASQASHSNCDKALSVNDHTNNLKKLKMNSIFLNNQTRGICEKVYEK